MPIPELLAPAGSLEMLKTALAFGADAVYAGQPRYSLRVRNNDFSTLDALSEGINIMHAAGKKLYIVSNIVAHNAKLKTFLADLAPVIALKPDALIMSDPGLIDLVRENWPEMPIHLSVQANTVNSASVRFWHKVGVERIILSRELALTEIAEIREACPEIELEVFVHGALCIAYSGRCLLSGYFNHRDANQGTCTNSCRWQYAVEPAKTDANSTIALIEEKERPGEWMPIEEDEHGTYILNSKDLRAIEYVAQLLAMGIDSLKIEGRTKSPYYVARSVQAYRHAIEDARAKRPFNPQLLNWLDGLANRGYTLGFYERHPENAHQNYENGSSSSQRSLYVGNVEQWDATRQMVRIAVKNRFAVGDKIEVIYPAGQHEFTLNKMENDAGLTLQVAPGSGHYVWIPLAETYVGAMLARFVA